MRLRYLIVILACLISVLTGPSSHSVAQAQQAPSSITRAGTIISINRAASSFVLSTVSGSPRQITVLAQRFTQISALRQGVPSSVSFASLAVGDRVVVNVLTLDSGMALALTTQIVARGTSGSVPSSACVASAGSGTGAATSPGSTTSGGAATGPGTNTSNSSSTGSGVSVGGSGSSSSAGNGVSAGANGSGSSAGNGVAAGGSGSGSSAGSAGASGAASSGGQGAGAGVAGGPGGVSVNR
jgi:hypothetical protein